MEYVKLENLTQETNSSQLFIEENDDGYMTSSNHPILIKCLCFFRSKILKILVFTFYHLMCKLSQKIT